MDRVPPKRALVSVYDKSGVVSFARGLVEAGCEIVSSGGTAAELRSAGLTVTDVSEVTGVDELLDGRVKTLHPNVHGGILADRSKDAHMRALADRGIAPFDLVVCNLYPFDREVTGDTTDGDAVELIDVGGPTMVRAAAKNFAAVACVTDPEDYAMVSVEIRSGGTTLATRRRLAAKAFSRLVAYDGAIAAWLTDETFPPRFVVAGERLRTLRYGENPHQQAALYRWPGEPRGIASGEQIRGDDPSYINELDLDAAFRIVTSFDEPASCVIKHTSPCGVAVASDIAEAYRLAFECDPRSAFGGIVGLNRACDASVVEGLREHPLLNGVVAPDFTPDALEELAEAKPKARLIRVPAERWTRDPVTLAGVSGGFLVQTTDPVADVRDEMDVVTKREPSDAEWDDLLFAWTVCAHVKSNAIVLANMRQAVGVGAGQMSRIEAFEIAVGRAGDRAKGSVAASEALFPFADSIEAAKKAGVTAIIQPGGAVRDEEVVEAADEADIAMVFTGRRHFLH